MKKICVSIILCFLLWSPSFAQEEAQDDSVQLVELANKVMLDIFDQIMASKDRYRELHEFDKRHLKKNEWGIYAIHYYSDDWDLLNRGLVYEFGITIVKRKADNWFKADEGYFREEYPLLDLQFDGYLFRALRSKQYDVEALIETLGEPLAVEQQKRMPLQLELVPVKEYYKPGEEIEFIVYLKNTVPNRAVRVKDLTKKSLSFVYNKRLWGVREVKPGKSKEPEERVILPLEGISKRFKGRPFLKPREFEVRCTYTMNFEGVHPANKMKINVKNP